MTTVPMWAWGGFSVVVATLLILDLGVFNRRAHTISVRAALWQTAGWVSLGLAFGLIVWRAFGSAKATQFYTGYLLEYALSADNIFVFVLVFKAFRVPAELQHRVLFWGIIGALVMRGLMIGAGAGLLERFDWIIYVFGAFLIYTGFKMAFGQEREIEPSQSPVIRALRRLMPVTDEYVGGRFFTLQNGKRAATPLFVVLMVVETTDLVFAVDSIPAIFSVTRDPFIVYTSNVFAILGLRSLYFALAGAMEMFHYLKYALAAVLALAGAKMLLHGVLHVPEWLALLLIAACLVAGVVASLLRPQLKHSTKSHR